MELVPDTTCLLCKQQTTVLKLDNVKSYLDKLFDTFFDKSNIFKDEFQGMVANASLCLMCTPKVNICCNLRNDYEDKYNGKCLQKLLSASGCLLCDGNLTPLTKTQDMPSSLLQQIELFMNSTSFPESYSNSALCLTCIHSLNIWHEVRSSIMKLRQNDEVDESNGANECTDSDSTDNSNFTKYIQLNSKKAKTKLCTPDERNVEKENVINLVNSDAEGVKKVDNQGKSATQTSLNRTAKVASDDETQSKENLSDGSRSESPSLLNNKFGKKFRHQQKIQKLALNKNVKNKESLISDSSDSEIDGLNKIVEEIVESYENEEAVSSQDFSKAKNSDKLNISQIVSSSDSENQSNSTQKSLNKTANVSPNKSPNPRWISKRKTLINVRSDSSDSESINGKKTKKLKRRRLSTFPEDKIDEGTKLDDSSDEEHVQKNTSKLNRSRLSVLSKGSSELENSKLKKADNDDQEKITKIDDSSDEERPQKNTQKLNRSRLSVLSKGSLEPERSKRKKSDHEDQEKTTKIDDSSDKEHVQESQRKLIRSKLSISSIESSESESSEFKKSNKGDQEKTPKIDDSSSEEYVQKSHQKLKQSRLSLLSKGSPEPERSKRKKSHNEDREKTTKIDDSSDEEHVQKNKRKLNRSRLSVLSKGSLKPESPQHKKFGNEDREKKTKIDDSSDEERPKRNTKKLNRSRISTSPKENLEAESAKHKRSDTEDREKTTKICDSSDEEHSLKNSKKPKNFSKKKCDPDKQKATKIVNSSSEDDEIMKDGNKQKPKIILKLKSQEYKKSKNKEQITESENSSDTENTQTFKPRRRSARLEAEVTIIDDSSDDESDHGPSSQRNLKSGTRRNRKSDIGEGKTKLIDDSSDSESAETENIQKLKGSKASSMIDNGKSNKDSESETTKEDDSSDSERSSDLTDKDQSRRSETRTSNRISSQKNKTRLRRLQIRSITEKNRDEASMISDSSDECESKTTRRKRSLRKFPSPPKFVFSDSSDQENMNTSTSNSENNKNHDNLWLYLNKRLKNLQSVKKLYKNDNINLPSTRLDDKFYKQLPYVLLEKNDKAQKTETVREKRVSEKFPKIKSRLQKRESVDKEDKQQPSRRLNRSPITITLSDDESQDIMNSSYVGSQTLCCHICDKISKTFCEYKAHDLFHEKPEEVVINVVRENLKQLQEKYNRLESSKVDGIMSKYLNISESSVGKFEETISNGLSSGNGSVEVEDEDSTSFKSHIPLPNEKSSSTSEDNSDCENVPNVVNEKKRKLSILLNNSRDKSDNSSPNPKRVRFALDHKTSIPNLQSTEDLTKTKSKYSCALI